MLSVSRFLACFCPRMLILASSHSLGPVFAGFFCGAAVSRPAARFVVSFPIPRVFRAQMLILASSCSLVSVLAGFHCGAAISRPAVRYVVSFSLPRAFLCWVVNFGGFSWPRAHFRRFPPPGGCFSPCRGVNCQFLLVLHTSIRSPLGSSTLEHYRVIPREVSRDFHVIFT